MYIIEGSTILRIIKRIFILDLVEVSKKKKINGRKCTFFIIYANTSRENFGKLSKQNLNYYFVEMKCIIHLQYLKIKIRNTKN